MMLKWSYKMNEVWKKIPNTNGKYLVNKNGEVKSLCKKNPRILVPCNGPRGYKLVSIFENGEKKTRRVHRLVAEAFIPNPDNKPEVNHIDGDKGNNSVDNLEWATRSENEYHAYRCLGFKAYEHPTKKVVCIETGKIYNSMVDAAKDNSTSRGAISNSVRGMQSAGGFHWVLYEKETEEIDEAAKFIETKEQ